jgi:NADH:ubiquinone oxidoreductase subunit D
MDTKLCPPTKAELKYSMEAIIHHFKIYSNGFSIPSNETYVSTEAPKGEFLRRGQLKLSIYILFIDVLTYFFI